MFGLEELSTCTFKRITITVCSSFHIPGFHTNTVFLGLVSIDGNSASKLSDFTALSSQLAKATPSLTSMNDYNPSNTAAQQCPTVGSDWQAASALPPVPNSELCGCMAKALTCTVDKSVSDDDIGDLFSTVCGLSKDACAGITNDPKQGTYGAYGMCNPREKLGWALNAYYEEQSSKGNAASACDFKGSATTQSAVKPTGNCSALVKQAGAQGTGTVTAVPTAIGSGSSASGSGGNSGSSGSGSSSSSGTGSPSGSAGIVVPSVGLGALQMGLYLAVAILSGAAMILL